VDAHGTDVAGLQHQLAGQGALISQKPVVGVWVVEVIIDRAYQYACAADSVALIKPDLQARIYRKAKVGLRFVAELVGEIRGTQQQAECRCGCEGRFSR
jgi:hypothetical protein